MELFFFRLKRPWLFLTPEFAHNQAAFFLKIAAWFFRFLCKLKIISIPNTSWGGFSWKGIYFKNPVGIAGGLDKNADQFHNWFDLGCGFAEIGTITPKPQGPNPGKIINRDIKNLSVWNKMGFPSPGAEFVFTNFKKNYQHIKGPVFINLGKNRDTPNDSALQDYLQTALVFKDVAQVFVINISSPNTKSLRDLAETESLRKLIRGLKENLTQKLLLKLSPDMSLEEFRSVVEVSIQEKIDGWILTNTTTAREPDSNFPKEGGASGKVLAHKSKENLNYLVKILENRRSDYLIVSAGGILSPQDIEERLKLGANLVQVYSGLVFEGPFFFIQAAKYFEKVQSKF